MTCIIDFVAQSGNSSLLYKVISSLVVFIFLILFYLFISKLISNVRVKNFLKPSREGIIKRFILFILIIILFFALFIIWGVAMKDVGIFLSSVLGLIAIGFFAVWSILSNVVACLFIFTAVPFRIEDFIEVPADDIRGKVIDIKLLFTVLEDEEGNILHVPNNTFFQKAVKKLNNKYL